MSLGAGLPIGNGIIEFLPAWDLGPFNHSTHWCEERKSTTVLSIHLAVIKVTGSIAHLFPVLLGGLG